MTPVITVYLLALLLSADYVELQPVTGETTLGFFTISNSSRQYLDNELDAVSDPVYIPYGFPFGNETHTKAYVEANGVISFGRQFRLCYPHQFPSDDPAISSANVLAPYWSNNDIRNTGEVAYTSFQYGDTTEGNVLLDIYRDYIRTNYPNATQFQGNFIILAEWNQVHSFPHGSPNLSSVLNYNPSIADFIVKENSYQAVAITDGADSYAIFTYNCNMLQWTGLWRYPVIGFNAAGHMYSNHSYSFTGDASDIACLSADQSNYTHIIFKISSEPSLVQLRQQDCWRWYFSDISFYGSIKVFFRFSPLCPCTRFQASYDLRWRIYYQFSSIACYINRVPARFGLGQICCYYRSSGAAILQGDDSGGFLPFYPDNIDEFSFFEYQPKQLCCSNSVGLCHLFKQRRPLQTCGNYETQTSGWAWGDPHFTTLDGQIYTFNGLGEYVLLRIDLINFDIQGRAAKVVDHTDATFFTSFALGIANTSDIVQISVLNESAIDVIVQNNSVAPNFEIIHPVPYFVQVVLGYDIGVEVQLNSTLQYQYLSIQVFLPSFLAGLTSGLLGNFNSNTSDDFIFRNGTLLDDQASDADIHEFSQSWQVTDQESLFFYEDNENSSTYAIEDHDPPFLDEITDELLANPQLTSVCGDHVLCLFDYNQTGDPAIGIDTAYFDQLSTFYKELNSIFPPIISAPEIFAATLGIESNYTVSIISQTGFVDFVVNGNSSLPNNVRKIQVDPSTVSLLWTPLNDEMFLLNVCGFMLYGDHLTAWSVFRPQIQLCNCQNGGTCTTDGVLQHDSSFVLLQCLCSPGYGGDFCEDEIDDCLFVSCLDGAECVKDETTMSVGCPCPSGYVEVDSKCVDIDECTNTYHGCHHQCQNIPGSYVCTCNEGFVLAEVERSCEVSGNYSCGPNECDQVCINVTSELSCSCFPGFELEPNELNCTDIDECNSQPPPCDQECNNTVGSFECGCRDGYFLGDDMLACYDIDECSTLPAPCSQKCNNTIGSFVCYCTEGYYLGDDMKTCHDIDECSTLSAPCSQECNNTIGSFVCYCTDGYYLGDDMRTCHDIDECSTLPAPCSQECNNTIGSFVCYCTEGYYLGDDMRTCHEHESESGESNKISTGAIVGISVGIVLVAAATLIIFLGGLILYYKSSYCGSVKVNPEKPCSN